MFKKLCLAVLICLLMTSQVWASPVNKTIISQTTLDDDPTSVTSTTMDIQDYKEVGFWVNYDETEVGNSVSVSITLDVSYNGSTWLDAKFYDIAGESTLQTSETLSSDGWYYCVLPNLYFPIGTTVKVRMVIAATNTDADDTAVVTAYLVGTK